MRSRMKQLFEYNEVWKALERLVQLQSHYADLLNMHDGGQRIAFKSAAEWLLRLRKMGKRTANSPILS